MAQDYYSILGVESDASPNDIKKAFRQIARECHPDVAGEDPVAAERFKEARKAYETLMDPVTRARYDRRGQRTAGGAPRGGSFFDAFYRHVSNGAGGAAGDGPNPGQHADGGRRTSYGNSDAGGHRSARTGRANPGNHVGLDDLFNDFGDFGFGGGGGAPRPRPGGSSGPDDFRRGEDPGRGPTVQAGSDVYVDLDVPAKVARDGGTVTAVYHRQQRKDSWRPGSVDPGIERIEDIAHIRLLPGVRDGQVVRERGLGDAGTYGGPYGDLYLRLHVKADTRPQADAGSGSRASSTSPAEAATPGERVVDISVVEALLGGRIELETPGGTVRVTIPAGTSSGARLRLKGRGEGGEDLFVRTRIVVPRTLDDESRALIERFAALNPGDPREG